MIWIMLLVSQCAFGFAVSHFVLKSCVNLVIEFMIGIPFGFAFSTFIFYFLSSFFAVSTFHIFLHIALLLSVTFVLIFIYGLKNFQSQLLSVRPNKTTIFFLVISFSFSAFIIFPIYYIDLPKINKSIQFEFNEEYTLINSFYVGCNSGFTNPFKIRHPYCYKCLTKTHWLTALHSAMLLTSFSTEKVAITIPSFLLFFQFCFIFLYFSRATIMKYSVYSILSLFIFCFAGGFGFIRWFWRDPRRDISNDFVYMWSSDKRTLWSHPILQYMLAYRPSLLSLSLIIDIAFILYKIIYNTNNKSNKERIQNNDDNFNSNDYSFNLFGIAILSAFTGILYGLTIPNQIEVTISFSVFILVFFSILFLTKRNLDQNVVCFLSFILGSVSIILPQIFILLRFRASILPIFSFTKFWQPLTSSGRFYGEIVVWFESLGFYAGITIVIVWIHLIYVAFISKASSPKLRDAAINAIKFYLPPFASFLFINRVQFHNESRQDIIAFYPCWMIFSSIIFIFTFDSIVESVKSTIRPYSSSKKKDSSSSDIDEIEKDDQNSSKNENETELLVNVHLRLTKNESQIEEAHLEEIQGILIGWFIFIFIVTVSSSLIGFDRLRLRATYAYTGNDKKLSDWIIKNTKIKDLFYMDSYFGFNVYSAVSSLSGRILIYDSSLISSFGQQNSFISPDKTPAMKVTQSLSRAGLMQDKWIHSDLDKLASNMTVKELIPKLKYVINSKNGRSKFDFDTKNPGNWKLVHEVGNFMVYERIK